MTLRDGVHNLNLEFTHYFALLCRLKGKTTTLRIKSTYEKLILGELVSTNKKSYYGQGKCLKNCNFRSGPSWVDLPVITAPPSVIQIIFRERWLTNSKRHLQSKTLCGYILPDTVFSFLALILMCGVYFHGFIFELRLKTLKLGKNSSKKVELSDKIVRTDQIDVLRFLI